jgi:hypothetical protein
MERLLSLYTPAKFSLCCHCLLILLPALLDRFHSVFSFFIFNTIILSHSSSLSVPPPLRFLSYLILLFLSSLMNPYPRLPSSLFHFFLLILLRVLLFYLIHILFIPFFLSPFTFPLSTPSPHPPSTFFLLFLLYSSSYSISSFSLFLLSFYFYSSYCFSIRSLYSIVAIATGYGLEDRGVGVRVPVGSRIFSSPKRPDQLWGPSSLLPNGYRRLFPRR